ncbi:hypothetical protein BKA61DRAFT_675805 [Leptodontidium sp. MPI-SDFR-AT-0119]|nr:hypothetical protein BKA61DRAFT_675805 [Leptodontidium sp. MPI-SDFR-AT-0119]
MSQQAEDTASRVPCSFGDCTKTFTRESDADRHVNEKHGPRKHCPAKGCKWMGAKRKDRLTAHMKSKHPELAFVHLYVPEDDLWMGVPVVEQGPGQNRDAGNNLQAYGATSTYGPNYAPSDMAQATYGTGPSSTSFSNQTDANQSTEWRGRYPLSQLNASDVDTAQYGEHQPHDQSSVFQPAEEDKGQYIEDGEEEGSGGY